MIETAEKSSISSVRAEALIGATTCLKPYCLVIAIECRPVGFDRRALTVRQIDDGLVCWTMLLLGSTEVAMKQVGLRRAFLIAAVATCGIFGSLDWSQNGFSLAVTGAQARVGRPLTPLSGAGVARRTTRRAVVGGAAVGAAHVYGAHCYHRVRVNGVWVCR